MHLDSVKWVRKKASTFRPDSFSPLYAALLHIYTGGLTLGEIAEQADMSREDLSRLRKNPRFFRYVDTFKKELSREIIEDLLVNTYRMDEYDALASDFSLFDEVFQMQIRVPLYSHLREIAGRIKSKAAHRLPIEMPDFRLFRRLFSFFLLMEKYTPTLVSKSLDELKDIASSLVWPSLGLDASELYSVLARSVPSVEERVVNLKARLRQM